MYDDIVLGYNDINQLTIFFYYKGESIKAKTLQRFNGALTSKSFYIYKGLKGWTKTGTIKYDDNSL